MAGLISSTRGISSTALNKLFDDIKKSGAKYPVTVETMGGIGDATSIVMLKEITNKQKVERISVEIPDVENPIKLEATVNKVTFRDPVKGENIPFTSVSLPDNMSLGELLELGAKASEIFLGIQRMIRLTLMSTENLKNLIPLSGKALYANIVDPEEFKFTSATLANAAKHMVLSTANGDPQSITSQTIDEMKQYNFFTNGVADLVLVKFLEFCKDNKDRVDDIMLSDILNKGNMEGGISDVKSANGKAVIVNSGDNNYTPLGSTDNKMVINSIGQLFNK